MPCLPILQDYTVRGLLGKATDDFCEDGRLVEKTTYGKSPRESWAGGRKSGCSRPFTCFLYALPRCGP